MTDATVWLGGREYTADKDGVDHRAVHAPSRAAGRSCSAAATSPASTTIEHQPESYRLAAGIHVDRESAADAAGRPGRRPAGLFLNGTPVSVKLLEDVKLRITSVDHDGIASSTEVPDFKLFEDRESVHEFRVPARLTVADRHAHREGQEPEHRQAGRPGRGRRRSPSTRSTGPTRSRTCTSRSSAPTTSIELLGRTGEAKPDRPVQLALKHRDFKEPVHVTLKTDAARPRRTSGRWPTSSRVTATGPEGTAHTWTLADRPAHLPRSWFTRKAGDVDRAAVPRHGRQADAATNSPCSRCAATTSAPTSSTRSPSRTACSKLRGLAAGRLRPVAEADRRADPHPRRRRRRAVAGHVLGTIRHLQLPGLKPVQIAVGRRPTTTRVTVRLQDASKFARVHVFATRYLPAFSAFANLARGARRGTRRRRRRATPESVYLTGRNIGDEYRYVLDRRGRRSSRATCSTGRAAAEPVGRPHDRDRRAARRGRRRLRPAGGEPRRRKSIPPGATPARRRRPSAAAGGDFANLDFLADASAVLLNLVAGQGRRRQADRARTSGRTR